MLMQDEAARKAQDQAQGLLNIVRAQARRAFVIELTGTPKAGKTTSVGILKRFFETCGYSVHLLKERAADCPLPMKGHFFFNAWTTCTMLAEVLQTVDTDVDVLILDRGFFDALVWLELQHKRDQITSEEKKTFSDFVLLNRWRRLVDVTIVMDVEPKTAVNRENAHLIVPRKGSVMNESALAEFNSALAETQRAYGDKFNFISNDPTLGIKDSNIALATKLLDHIDKWANPNILAVPRVLATRIFNDKSFIQLADQPQILQTLLEEAESRRRSEFEADDNFVQLVACGIHRSEDGFFVLGRSEKDAKRSYGQTTLWKGCHVEAPSAGASGLADIKNQLKRRILEDLHLATLPDPTLNGIAWNSTDKHLGLMFEVSLDSPHTIDSMRRKEFRKSGRHKPLIGQFLTREELLAQGNSSGLEPWSQVFLSQQK